MATNAGGGGSFRYLAPQQSVAVARPTPAIPPGAVAPPASSGGVYSGPFSSSEVLGEPFAVWVGMLAILALLGWFSNNPDSLGGANPAQIKIGGYNFFAIGVNAALFIALLKIIANSAKLPGFTEFANAL